MSEPKILQSYKGKKILVLGATGFIGRWVARLLSQAQADVYLLIRDGVTAKAIFKQYQIQGTTIIYDLNSLLGLESLCHSIKPAMVFNLAGYGVDRSERNEGLAYQLNKCLPEKLCQIIATMQDQDPSWSGQNLIHVGSALEYGQLDNDLAEDSIPNPTTLYGRSKLAGTLAVAQGCKDYNLRGLTARIFMVYGPGEHSGRLLSSLLAAAKTKLPLDLTAGTQKRDFTYVQDVALGLLKLGLLSKETERVVNLATGNLSQIKDFVEIAAQVLQIKHSRLNFGALPQRIEEMSHLPVNINRLKTLLQWQPQINVITGIKETVNFYY